MSFVLAEGAYTSYAVYDSFDDSDMSTYYNQCAAWVNCLETKAILFTANAFNYIKTYDIDTKTLGSHVDVDYNFASSATLGHRFKQTFLNTYAAFIESSTRDILIYKNGVLLQRLTLTEIGLELVTYFSISFSPRGKYIFLAGKRSATLNPGWVVLKGT